MNTLLHWLGQIAVIIALLLLIGIPIWIYESRAKKKKFEAAFAGRDPLDEQMFYEQYFQLRGVPTDVVVTIRRILEDVLGADMSRLKAEDDLTRNLSFFFQFDSMADVELVERLEEEFNIKIADEEAEQTRTVEDIVALVWLKYANAPHKCLERTRLDRASLLSCVGEPLKRGVRRLSGVCLVSIDWRALCPTARSVTLKFQQ